MRRLPPAAPATATSSRFRSSSVIPCMIETKMNDTALAPSLTKSHRLPVYFRDCEKCGQDALILKDELPFCLYCGNQPSSRALAYNSEGDAGPCPNCEHGRLGIILWNNEEGTTICVLCGFTAEGSGQNGVCDYCGEDFWDETGDSLNICSD